MNKTDIHSHILFNVDDGSKSIKESICLLQKLKNIGFTDVILTPHYINGSSYNISNDKKRKHFNILKEELIKNKLDINIYLGNEIFINNNINNLIKEDVISTLNNSKYVLVELPFHNPILNLDDIIYELKYNNLIPIIAHPERYTYFQKNYKEVDKLREEGVLFQGNYLSIIGGYGSLSKKLFKYMLKNKYIDFLGTDIHSLNNLSVIDNYDKIIKKIKKVCGEEYYQVIINNCNNVLKNI